MTSVILLICTWPFVLAIVQAFRFIWASPNCAMMHDESIGYEYKCDTNETSFYGIFNESQTFYLFCRWSDSGIEDVVPLELKSLPIFHPGIEFQEVKLVDCVPTAGGSYADALAIMNINASMDRFDLRFEHIVSLSPHHFTGLSLRSMAITTVYNDGINFDFKCLEPLGQLMELNLAGMIVPPMPVGNIITSVNLMNGEAARFLQPWGDCTYLEQLDITYWRVDILPDEWLANCPRLHSLRLKNFRLLRRLPSRMLKGVYSLKSLTISGCKLEVLPTDFLSYTKELRFLDLSDNSIVYQPSNGIFSSLPSLEILDISSNKIIILAVTELAPLVSLRSLSINNIKEVDIKNFNESALKWPVLPSLKQLFMKHSHIKRLWPKWYETMPALQEFDLTGNEITTLTYQDVLQIHTKGWEVNLRQNPIEAILFEQSDYEEVLMDHNQGHNDSSRTTIWIDSPIHCDCRWYWFIKLIQELPKYYVSVPELRCSQTRGMIEEPKPVQNMSLKEMLCQLPESECAPGCVCYRREPDNMAFVNCTDAGIKKIPQINKTLELHLANNHITTLHTADLPNTLTFLDLKYNRLARVDDETASKMFTVGSRTYKLAGNPIICDCSNRAMIEALHRNAKMVIDYENVTCVDKQNIGNVDINKLCISEHVTLVAGVIGTLAVLMVILFAVYYRYRREVHVILRRWGCSMSCCVSDKEHICDKVYDVFICFAYDDSTFITDELLPKLEQDPNNLKVCVHYRDWVVGDWIPMQIARSVEESRHTMIVLSENFLSSVWALLEFRTAHKKALKERCTRLVIVLLEDVIGDKRIDPELRAYLVTNTYIKRDDPRFWEKLQQALPHQRCARHRNCKDRATGEEVVQLIRVTDPPIRQPNGCELRAICNDVNANDNVTARGTSEDQCIEQNENMETVIGRETNSI